LHCSAPFVTPEDILLAKLHWYRAGGEVSEVQWRDIKGIVRTRGQNLDVEYLKMAPKSCPSPIYSRKLSVSLR